MPWIPQPLYLQHYPTESAHAIQKRLKRGIWKDRVHAHTPEGSEHRWINTDAVQAWASGETATTDTTSSIPTQNAHTNN